MTAWLRYGIAFVIACHGLTYAMFGFLAPAQLRQWSGTSRLLGTVLGAERVRAAVPVIHLVAGVFVIAAAAALAFAPSASFGWRPLAVIGAVSGLAAFAVFWDGQVKYIVEEGGIGAGLSMVLLVAALA